MKRYWYTSDNHFGHTRIIELGHRPFSSLEEMEEVMVERWNALVGPEDIVIHVGDIAMGIRKDTLQIVRRLNGKIVLIPGNHDKVWRGHKKVAQADIELYESVGLSILPSEVVLPLGPHMVLVCHLPYTADPRHGELYADKRPVDEGRWLICGHVHNEWRVNGRQINVGVDVNGFAPVSEEEILSLME